MIDLFPFIYSPKHSIAVLEKSDQYLKDNPKIKTEIEELGRAYHSIGKSIPQTSENYWSGHYFPYIESWNELQISFNLAVLGLYKQAFTSLRSALEVGMLSVYYNINDEGHNAVKNWLRSKDSWEANTPRANKVWKILKSNENIAKYNELFGLEEIFDSLSFLHNYVHTKGYKYSNLLGFSKTNYQTFEENVFLVWLETYRNVITLIITLHILKYPITIIEYDWSRKVGIDNPYPVLGVLEIKRIKKILPENCVTELKRIADNDATTQDLFGDICGMPDITEEEVESQIIQLDKMFIEHGEGFVEWEKREKEMLEKCSEEEKAKALRRIEIIRKWAVENNMMKPMMERLKEKGPG